MLLDRSSRSSVCEGVYFVLKQVGGQSGESSSRVDGNPGLGILEISRESRSDLLPQLDDLRFSSLTLPRLNPSTLASLCISRLFPV